MGSGRVKFHELPTWAQTQLEQTVKKISKFADIPPLDSLEYEREWVHERCPHCDLHWLGERVRAHKRGEAPLVGYVESNGDYIMEEAKPLIGPPYKIVCPFCRNNFTASFKVEDVDIDRVGFDAPSLPLSETGQRRLRFDELPDWAKRMIQRIRPHWLSDETQYEIEFVFELCRNCHNRWLNEHLDIFVPVDTASGRCPQYVATLHRSDVIDANGFYHVCPFCGESGRYSGNYETGHERVGFDAPSEKVRWEDVPEWAKKEFMTTKDNFKDCYYTREWMERICRSCGRLWLSEIWNRFQDTDPVTPVWLQIVEKGSVAHKNIICPFCGFVGQKSMGHLVPKRQGYDAPSSDPEPVPGDLVQVTASDDTLIKPGSYGVLEGTIGAHLPEYMVTFNFTPPFREKAVSASGGPAFYIPVTNMKYIGRTTMTFWKWKDFPRAGGGENYEVEVNVFAVSIPIKYKVCSECSKTCETPAKDWDHIGMCCACQRLSRDKWCDSCRAEHHALTPMLAPEEKNPIRMLSQVPPWVLRLYDVRFDEPLTVDRFDWCQLSFTLYECQNEMCRKQWGSDLAVVVLKGPKVSPSWNTESFIRTYYCPWCARKGVWVSGKELSKSWEKTGFDAPDDEDEAEPIYDNVCKDCGKFCTSMIDGLCCFCACMKLKDWCNCCRIGHVPLTPMLAPYTDIVDKAHKTAMLSPESCDFCTSQMEFECDECGVKLCDDHSHHCEHCNVIYCYDCYHNDLAMHRAYVVKARKTPMLAPDDIKVGDWVVVHKPRDVEEIPTWDYLMDRYDGEKFKVVKVSDYRGQPVVYLDGTHEWSFNVKWVELFKPKTPMLAPDDIKVGDWVVVHKPEDIQEIPTWDYLMDKYDGKRFMVEHISVYKGQTVLSLDGTKGWSFNINWVKLSKPKTPMLAPSEWSPETQKLLTEGKGYRCEGYSGSGVRDPEKVLDYEVYGLGNWHVIQDACNGLGLVYTGYKDDEETLRKIILELEKRYGRDDQGRLKATAVWLGGYEDMKERFCDGEEPEAWDIPSDAIVLSDLEGEGALFMFSRPSTPMLAPVMAYGTNYLSIDDVPDWFMKWWKHHALGDVNLQWELDNFHSVDKTWVTMECPRCHRYWGTEDVFVYGTNYEKRRQRVEHCPWCTYPGPATFGRIIATHDKRPGFSDQPFREYAFYEEEGNVPFGGRKAGVTWRKIEPFWSGLFDKASEVLGVWERIGSGGVSDVFVESLTKDLYDFNELLNQIHKLRPFAVVFEYYGVGLRDIGVHLANIAGAIGSYGEHLMTPDEFYERIIDNLRALEKVLGKMRPLTPMLSPGIMDGFKKGDFVVVKASGWRYPKSGCYEGPSVVPTGGRHAFSFKPGSTTLVHESRIETVEKLIRKPYYEAWCPECDKKFLTYPGTPCFKWYKCPFCGNRRLKIQRYRKKRRGFESPKVTNPLDDIVEGR